MAFLLPPDTKNKGGRPYCHPTHFLHQRPLSSVSLFFVACFLWQIGHSAKIAIQTTSFNLLPNGNSHLLASFLL